MKTQKINMNQSRKDVVVKQNSKAKPKINVKRTANDKLNVVCTADGTPLKPAIKIPTVRNLITKEASVVSFS